MDTGLPLACGSNEKSVGRIEVLANISYALNRLRLIPPPI